MARRELRVKRVYEKPEKDDGLRILVDRLWPRGLTKEKAKVDLWLKAVSPSNDLRRRFHAQPELWAEFVKAYAKELKAPEAHAALEDLRHKIAEGPVTLLFAARDEEHNNATALVKLLPAKR